jgi:hypothetical protein
MGIWQKITAPLSSFHDYWKAFGGINALITSPYLWGSIAITFFLYWFKGKFEWLDAALSTVPSLLGFTVAAYAILVAFGDEKFKKIIAIYPRDASQSFFMTVNGTFCHFIIVQCGTLIYAVLFKTLGLNAIRYQFVGMILLMYSLSFTVATALAVLKMAKMYQNIIRSEKPDEHKQELLRILLEIRDRLPSKSEIISCQNKASKHNKAGP